MRGKQIDNRNVVLGAYPKAECKEIFTPTGSYYLIYDMESLTPDLIGYDMSNETKAWDMAADRISKLMIETLEKSDKK